MRHLVTFLVYLDKFGMYTLTAGILYSIVALLINTNNLRSHFMTVLAIIFLGYLALVSHTYLKRKHVNDRMKNIVKSMKVE